MIALSDRYALGFWSTDSYATQLNIVAAGSSGVQKVANAASFYTNAWAIQKFENRLSHIMNHRNSFLGGQKWADLDEVIYAVERESPVRPASPYSPLLTHLSSAPRSSKRATGRKLCGLSAHSEVGC